MVFFKDQSYDVERCSPKDAEDCINIFYISTQPIDNATYVVEALGNKFRGIVRYMVSSSHCSFILLYCLPQTVLDLLMLSQSLWV
jgi:hypothetical protein